MGKDTDDKVAKFITKLIKGLLYLHGISDDAGYEPLACIFNITLVTILAGPKEVEVLHGALHKYHNDFVERMGGEMPTLDVTVKDFIKEAISDHS